MDQLEPKATTLNLLSTDINTHFQLSSQSKTILNTSKGLHLEHQTQHVDNSVSEIMLYKSSLNQSHQGSTKCTCSSLAQWIRMLTSDPEVVVKGLLVPFNIFHNCNRKNHGVDSKYFGNLGCCNGTTLTLCNMDLCRAFNIFPVYQYFTFYRWYFVLKF